MITIKYKIQDNGAKDTIDCKDSFEMNAPVTIHEIMECISTLVAMEMGSDKLIDAIKDIVDQDTLDSITDRVVSGARAIGITKEELIKQIVKLERENDKN